MKKSIHYLVMFLLILMLLYYSCLHYTEKNTLTKGKIWSIIDNIDGTLLGIMTKNGEKELSDESKIDYLIKYLIENKKRYSNIIEYSDNTIIKNDTIYYNFGKVKSSNFKYLLNDFFYNFGLEIENHHLFKNNYIELFYEPIDYISSDSSNISSYYIYKGKIYMYVNYYRNIGNVNNCFKVKYVLDKNTYKICNVVILNSQTN